MARRVIVAMALLVSGIAAAVPGVVSAVEPAPAVLGYSVTPSTTQAGGHPDVDLRFEFSTSNYLQEPSCSHDQCTSPRTIENHFPTGFIGNPHVAPKCTLAEFSGLLCPIDSQIGILYLAGGGETRFVPLFNMETNPEQAGLVAGSAPVVKLPIFLELSGRTDSDYGLDAIGSPIQRGFPLKSVFTVLWGVPADPVHNPHRFQLGATECKLTLPPDKVTPPVDMGCEPGGSLGGGTFADPGVPPAPYLQNPTTCGTPLVSTLDLTYYDGTVVHGASPWPDMTGCQQLTFNPSQTTKPTTTRADTASGLDVDLQAPLPQSPTGASPSEIRKVALTLPEGFSLNPSAGDGKLACSDAQTSIGTLLAATCPEFAKIGTAEVNVAALPGPIFGGLYLGEPKPGEPYRLILTADGFATHVKQAGTVRADPQTGQLTTVFEIPQSPIQQINLHIFGSERGVLATPERCGVYKVANEFVPWDHELATRFSTSLITIDAGPNGAACPQGPRTFAPRLETGASNNTAAAHSTFSFTIDRDDGDQNLSGIDVSTPPGWTASLKGIPYCPEPAIAQLSGPGHSGVAEKISSACPPASRVGSAVAGAGPGSRPLYVPGDVYLAGPYKGAQLSIVTVVPAVSGPYDLGNVAVRAALRVDPITAQVTALADPLPQIIEGIPVRTRFVRIDLDRPSFAINPTNCSPLSVAVRLAGDEGGASDRRSRFQVANCDELAYAPKLSLRLTGGLNRRGHPAIHALFTANPGEANTRSISVTLPKGELLDNSHIGTVCTRPAFAQHACPASAKIGTVEARTPLLDAPLRGSVYLRSSSNDLPDMALDLRGQIDVAPAARIDSVNGRLRATFESVPDVPLSSVSLHLAGGKKGLLQNTRSLCGRDRAAVARMQGHNGTRQTTRVKLRVACAGRGRR